MWGHGIIRLRRLVEAHCTECTAVTMQCSDTCQPHSICPCCLDWHGAEACAGQRTWNADETCASQLSPWPPDHVPSRLRHTLPQLYRLGLNLTVPPPVVVINTWVTRKGGVKHNISAVLHVAVPLAHRQYVLQCQTR
jgi:hypothetical protein